VTDLFLVTTISDISTSDRDYVADFSRGTLFSAMGNTSTVAGPTSGVQQTDPSLGSPATWWSPLLAGGVTISGTMTLNVWMLESSMNANVGAQIEVVLCDGAGTAISTIVNTEKGVELGTSFAVQNWTATPTSTTISNGQRLRIRIFGNDAGGTMASGFTFNSNVNGATGGSNGDSWVRFTETLTAWSYSFTKSVPVNQAVNRATVI